MKRLYIISLSLVILVSSCGAPPNNTTQGAGNTVESVTVDDRVKKTPSELVITRIESEKMDKWTDDSYDMVYYYVHIPDMDVSGTYDDFAFVDTLGKFKVNDRVRLEVVLTPIRESEK